ncbi:MAG TPA: hypothetical protein VGO50_17040 [Pyrinomonadaceae bacterium]|jgi:hypothetical protein|nr:hypothetical protein [Pyrinomonadaceae bacterium]
MSINAKLKKIKTNLPWLARYPFARVQDFLGREPLENKHIIFTVANHFEPGWKESGVHDLKTQIRRLKDYYKIARDTGEAVKDADGTKFRHGNFYPAEQYHPELLSIMAEMQAEGLGEVEIHLHHGVEKPDTAENLRRSLLDFRDCLAEEHKCLSQADGKGSPMYAFVHGNLALANSHGGKYCGVDEEMQILQETGCYADMTLPSAPEPTQVPMINQIYECGLPLGQKIPHRKGLTVSVNGKQPLLPLIFTGPLVFDWGRRIKGLPVPSIDEGGLTASKKLDRARLQRWLSANITVKGRPDWVFVKLYCHGFIEQDQPACIGEDAKRFFSDVIEQGEKDSSYKVHFAAPREAFNMVAAAIDGKAGSPGDFRNYRLRAIMDKQAAKLPILEKESILIC